ncbi:MAG: 23S rRNA (guanosine(2251)-2'-O)-methyltransferase RlmB [Elusimicrobia bacterium]|nr:23S rRNA (guanosine(2251)-2'-O)-methyltransferase RlmB [Elusimicrobiota bacterium]
MGESWEWLWGRHAVEETLKSGSRRVRELWVLHQNRDGAVRELVNRARRAGARVKWVSKKELDAVAQDGAHQGLALRAEGRTAGNLDDFMARCSENDRRRLVLIALDQIQDPHNLGAIARSGACLGAAGLLLSDRRTAPVSPAAVQASAGALEKMPVFLVGNLAQALARLRDAGVWIYGADRTGKPVWNVTFNRPMILVIGSEGQGMRSLIREACDEIVAIPQSSGGVQSLNASCAAGVLLYEIARQSK